MKNILYILVFSLCIISCSNDVVKKPDNFISKEQMIALIVDMKIASKTRNYHNKDLKKKLNYMAFVYKKHKIDSTQFKENNIYYVHHLEKYQEIYKEVERRLQDSLAKYEKSTKVQDSIKKKTKKLLLKKQLRANELSIGNE